MPSAPPPPTLNDVSRLPHDPGKRQPIASYHANDHNAIWRAYILRGPFQPYAYEFSNREIGDRDHHFVWFKKFPWIEYSVKKDAAFCFMCYLFKSKANKGKGTSTFTSDGWNNWNKGSEALLKHVGSMLGAFESFDFVFDAHLMFVILGYTNDLSVCLQRREQDIINAISLVNVAKRRMQ
jgi:hypothetical protein